MACWCCGDTCVRTYLKDSAVTCVMEHVIVMELYARVRVHCVVGLVDGVVWVAAML